MQRTGVTTLRSPRPSPDAKGPDSRLAELVAHLTGCAPSIAVDAVDHALPHGDDELTFDDRLGVVAQALVQVSHDLRLDLRRPA